MGASNDNIDEVLTNSDVLELIAAIKTSPLAVEQVLLSAKIDTIIAHSFGCIATASALKAGAKADYVILIAPPVLGWAEAKRREGVDPAVLEGALEVLRAEGRGDLAPFDFTGALAGYSGKLLFIGSDADIDVLNAFIAHPEFRALKAHNAQDLVNRIKWATTAPVRTVSRMAERSMASRKASFLLWSPVSSMV